VPQSEEPPRQRSWVAESLWDNSDIMHARFHVGRFVTVAVDTEAERKNIEALYSSLKTTSDQIYISAQQLTLLQLLSMDMILPLCKHWLNIPRTRINS
jgi:hypothetical protein